MFLNIKKIVLPLVVNLNFTYIGKRDSVSWILSRTHTGGAIQYLCFEKIASSPSCLRMVLSTTVTKEVCYHYQLDSTIDPFGISYEDQSSLNRALKQLTHLFLSKGLEWLALMSSPDVLLERNHYEQFWIAVQAGWLDENEFPVSRSLIDDIKKIEERVVYYSREAKGVVDYNRIQEYAIIFSFVVKHYFGGKWELEKNFSLPLLVEIGQLKELKINPLAMVAKLWSKPAYPPYSLITWVERAKKQLKK
ncbi:hypothetical protein ACFO9Q_03020 [Paenibacillus sp. GCM10023252]|uniref:hypothetical protein n=1 Tax=Paenibacillus sp. GCM10023252 TaxID=3252649 RepID=UPI00361EFF60